MRKKWLSRLAIGAAALLVASELAAQDGLYIGSELGAAFAPSMRLVGVDNDWGTRCDKLINPDGLETGGECDAQPPPTEWTNESRGVRGFATGFALGYRLGRWRAEVQYGYRGAPHYDYASTQIGDAVTEEKAEQELEKAIGGAGHVRVHGVFANLALDLRTNSRLTPYVGVGGGIARMSIDYFSLWKRNGDPSLITTFEDAALRAKLAGTTTLGATVLNDTMFGFQVLAGLDYRATDRFTVGLKLTRPVMLGAFESKPHEWDQLRSHDSTVGRGSRIVYTVETRDTGAYNFTVSLRFAL